MKNTIVVAGILLAAVSFCFAAEDKRAAIVFEKKKLKIGTQTLEVEIADTPDKSARGLMFRTTLAEGKGMLFIFENEQTRAFWMKNTFVPLSIGYFNSKKELVDIQDMKPVTSEMETNPPSYPSAVPAMYALEVPQGWFQKHKIHLKQKFKLD